MRVLAFVLLCALPSAVAAQTADYAKLIETKLSTYERELRGLNSTVERLQRQLDALELRLEAMERAAAQRQTPEAPEPPAADAESEAAPVAAADEAQAAAPAALPGGDALELYEEGRNLLLQARLPEAEDIFQTFLNDFAEHKLANNARHWLATSLAGQGKHGPAAQQFLTAYEQDPEGPKAPDNLLKLGQALAALDKREEACIALSRLSRKHKQAPVTVLTAAEAERRRLQC